MGTTSLLVNEICCIDAGNILAQLGEDAKGLDHIFLTHSHLDHILDLPSLIDTFYSHRTTSLNVYALKETVYSLKKHIFNECIWPDFSAINLPNGTIPAIVFHELDPIGSYRVGDATLYPFATKHSVPSVGYVIEKNGNKLMFTSDTYCDENLWEIINNDTAIKVLIIEVSFSSVFDKLAEASLHLTPKLLDKELDKLMRKDIKIYINHIKPTMRKKIVKELREFNNTKDCIVLEDGMVIEF